MGRRGAALQQTRGWRGLPVLAVAAAFGLSGCASISQKFAESASQLPQVGLSANAPARPAQQMAYPAVHDVPPPRTSTVLTDIEQQKLETDLISARNQQQTAAGVPLADRKKTPAAKDQGRKDQNSKVQSSKDQSSKTAPISASSSRTIY
jgi:hypothetical protein